MITNHIIAAAMAVVAMGGAYQYVKQTGVRQEQVRVETVGKKIDAAAKAKRKAVEVKKPDEISADLRRFCVDCASK